MAINKASAQILNMGDARARRRGDLKDIGAQLAAAREARGLSISEASRQTHIKESHLTAIETIDVEALPARPYAIGFVRSYADFLEMEVGPVVTRFKEEAGYEAAAPIEVERFRAAEAANEAVSKEMSLWAFGLVLAFILWCAYQLTVALPNRAVLDASAAGGDAQAVFVADPALHAEPTEIIEARIIERIEPVFPRRCAPGAQNTETVVISFNISDQGRVRGERVADSTNSCLNDAALNAIRRWQFEPRQVDGAARPAFDQKYSFSFQRPL